MALNYFYNFDESGIETTLTIKYLTATGKGRFECHLDNILPCNKSKFKLVLDMVAMQCDCASWDAAAAILYNYIEFCTRELKKSREIYLHDARKAAQFTAEIKKYVALSEVLADRFGTPILSDGEKIRFKSGIFYAFDHGKVQQVVDGSTFEFGGHKFGAYARGKGDFVIVAIDSGLVAANGTSKASAIEEFRRIFDNIQKAMTSERYAECVERFHNALFKAGYIEKPEKAETACSPISEDAASDDTAPETPDTPAANAETTETTSAPDEAPERHEKAKAASANNAAIGGGTWRPQKPEKRFSATALALILTGRRAVSSGYFSPAPPGKTLRQIRGSPALIEIEREMRCISH